MIYLFTLTLTIVILNLFLTISIIAGHIITLPPLIYKLGWTDPTNSYLFYPSLFYQIYWWVNYFNLF
jgi:hypothetical protein